MNDTIGWDQLHALVEASMEAEHTLIIGDIHRLMKKYQSDSEGDRSARIMANQIITLIKARG